MSVRDETVEAIVAEVQARRTAADYEPSPVAGHVNDIFVAPTVDYEAIAREVHRGY